MFAQYTVTMLQNKLDEPAFVPVGRMSPTTPPIMLGLPDPTYHSDIPPLQALCSFLKFHGMYRMIREGSTYR